ncbi:MAG: TonB-dependent receptor [Xanthomonadales bacterium]|nr:TonB-dependent receptor [Xanthomonadales bacterium]
MQTKLVKNPLAAGIALALGVGGVSQVRAQETPQEVEDPAMLEEVVVTAIRQSLISAQSLKENSDTFVDGVTAQDIGALPDRSVAEALQRVPGVNISRYKKSTDPDRFSVEGADVIIRGLPFVRSELNGRDVFSATGGTVLSFNDVSPELLGSVLVYKNATADMIDGGIAGTVNLNTRKPLDTDGVRIAGSLEANYGDIAEETSPTLSFLGSNVWETSGGRIGLQLGYAQSELVTTSNASQVTDPCYRDPALDAGCIRVTPVTSGGVGSDFNFTPETFPPSGAIVVPKGAGVRTTGYERDRNAVSLIGQYETDDASLLVTAEYLRADAELFVDEHAILALVNDDALFPVPATGTNWNFAPDGSFQSGTLSQVAWRGIDNCLDGSLLPPEGLDRPCNVQIGIPTELLRFQRQDDSLTEDFSLDIAWTPNDNLTVNFAVQQLESERSEDGIIGAMSTYSDIFLDMSGETPDVQFITPITTDGSTDPNYFTNPDRTYYSFLLDSQIENEADMTTAALDFDYYFGEEKIIKGMKFGARWSDRNRITRDNRFANWGLLSAPWSGFTPATYVSEPTGDVSTYAQVYNPFADFQRGETSIPVQNGAAIFYGGPDFLGEYFNGTTEQQANDIIALNPFGDWGNAWGPVYNRDNLVNGPFTAGEISDVSQQTEALYLRFDFGFEGDRPISGNFGVRYVETTVESDGQIGFPFAPPDPSLCNPEVIPPGGLPGFCSLSPAREAEFLSAFTGETIADDADIEFSHWLPSLNVQWRVQDDLLLRAAASKGISRPDLAAFATGGAIFDNTNALRDEGTLETGPLFALQTGNRLLEPVEAWSYDLSAEWYFAAVGSLTFTLFKKDFEALITNGATIRTLTSDSGASAVTEIRGPANVDEGTMEGFEVTYQQTFDMLPYPWSAFGAQATYTYIDAEGLLAPTDSTARSPFADGLSLPGVSEDTVNLVAFFENESISARLAWNWRSEFLITPRDDIFPFSPIIGEDTGQLDGSIFYTFNSQPFGITNMQIGLQVVNILDEVTQTSQIVDFDGTTFPRSAFRNDRRYTVAFRFNY